MGNLDALEQEELEFPCWYLSFGVVTAGRKVIKFGVGGVGVSGVVCVIWSRYKGLKIAQCNFNDYEII